MKITDKTASAADRQTAVPGGIPDRQTAVPGGMIHAKAVVFDIDNTLYDYDRAHAAAFADLSDFTATAFDLSPERFTQLHRQTMDIQRQYAGTACAAIHNRLIRFQYILEQIHKPVSYAPEMASRYWNVFLDNIRPSDGLYECFDRLHEQGFVIGIGTNMTADYQYEKLRWLNLLDQIDFIVSSEEINAEKPDRKLFDRCAEKAGCTVGECVFVGDNPTDDVNGALDAGMRAVWYVPDQSGKVPDITIPESVLAEWDAAVPDTVPRITSLADLPALLVKI